MNRLFYRVITGLFFLACNCFSFAQETQMPRYQDGEWWKLKVEVVRQQAVSRSGACHEQYSDYLVKIEGTRPVVYGISGNTEAKIDCPQVTSELLDTPSEWEYLKFPLAAGKSWSTRVFFKAAAVGQGRWFNYTTKVVSVENLKTEKGEVKGFKIERLEQNVTETYFYLPEVKANALFDRKVTDPRGGTANRKVTLTDFKVQ